MEFDFNVNVSSWKVLLPKLSEPNGREVSTRCRVVNLGRATFYGEVVDVPAMLCLGATVH